MPIDRLDFDNLTEQDLAELFDTQVPEGLRIEYKRDPYGRVDSEKREFLKDVSALANAFGGHLIIGVEAQNGLPINIPGVLDVNSDDLILWMEQLIRTGIEPPIQGIRIRAVPLANTASCFVLRIPRSWYPPHRVSAQNSNRFWIRNSNGVHEASVEELRTMFTLGADAFRLVHQFRDERVGEIVSGNCARPLSGSGRLILHIVPLVAVTSSWQINLSKANEIRSAFHRIGGGGLSTRFNFEGFINESGRDQNIGYTQIFRNGALEATQAEIIASSEDGGDTFIPSLVLEEDIIRVVPAYLNGLRDLGVPPPLVVLITLEGVVGVRYAVHETRYGRRVPTIERDVLCLPECVVNEYGSDADYHRAVKPAFDALWNTTGRAKAETFSDDGIWMGDTRR